MSGMLLALICGVRSQEIGPRDIVEHVDLIEVNHRYYDSGEEHFAQVILYQWSSDYQRLHVMHWWLVSNGPSVRYDANRKKYCARWKDRRRVVWSDTFRETWTEKDPERLNKRILEERYRIGLIEKANR